MGEIKWEQNEEITEEKKEEVKTNLNIVFNDYMAETGEDKSIVNKFDIIISDKVGKKDSNNGVTIIPKNENDIFLILINSKQINKYSDYAHTFPHELTHVFDFSKCMYDNKITTEKELLSSGYYNAIYYWSEFHARYYSFKYAVKYINKSKEEILKEIIEPGFNKYMQILKEAMGNGGNDGVEILTQLMYQYGRFIAFKEYGFIAIEQEEFPRETIKNMFGDAGIRIYYLFENISNYEEFRTSYSKIVDILEEIRMNFDDFRYEYHKR